jgi:hypothetical protein
LGPPPKFYGTRDILDSGHAITDLFERLVAEVVKSGADDDCIAAAQVVHSRP